MPKPVERTPGQKQEWINYYIEVLGNGLSIQHSLPTAFGGLEDEAANIDLSNLQLSNAEIQPIFSLLEAHPEHKARIKTLNLGFNNLTSVKVDDLPNLQELSLRYNYRLKDVPSLPKDCTKLDLYKSGVSNLHIDFAVNPNLKVIDIGGCYMKSRPTFKNLQHIGTKDISLGLEQTNLTPIDMALLADDYPMLEIRPQANLRAMQLQDFEAGREENRGQEFIDAVRAYTQNNDLISRNIYIHLHRIQEQSGDLQEARDEISTKLPEHQDKLDSVVRKHFSSNRPRNVM